jgi:hypothetical protein
MSFHEKSAWACLISLAVVYVPYFFLVLRFPMAAIGLFWVSVFVLAVLLAAFHTVNAVATRSIRTTGVVPPVDELDERIELQAAKWAGLILGIAILAWILIAMYPILGIGTGEGRTATHTVSMFAAMAAVQWLFAAFVLANAVYYGAIVFRYRRLAIA